MKLYENVVIGNFLYGLGFAVRSHLSTDAPFPGVVNLLQQTPTDKELGDVLLTFPGAVRLLEFKMKGARLEKETRRHNALSLALQGANQHLIETSRRVHWYVEVSAAGEHSPLVSRVVPYLDGFTDSSALSYGGFENLIKQTALDAVQSDTVAMHERAKIYLDLIRVTMCDRATGAGGLLIVTGAGGGIHFAQLRDIYDLTLPDRLWLEKAWKTPELESSPPIFEQQVELERSRKPDRGLSM